MGQLQRCLDIQVLCVYGCWDNGGYIQIQPSTALNDGNTSKYAQNITGKLFGENKEMFSLQNTITIES